MSIRGKIFSFFTGMTQNINPFLNPEGIEKMKKMSLHYIDDKPPKDCTLKKYRISSCAGYEIVQRKGRKSDKYIYYLHGGAYVTGLLSMYRSFAIGLSDNISAVLLDYSLAPEYKYPVQLEEAYSVWNELTEKKGILPENIIIGGDSSGGNLALALMLKLKDEGRKMPCGCFLLSAWTDMLASGKSYFDNYGKDIQMGEKNCVLTKEKHKQLIESDLFCCFGNADRKNPYVSPVYGAYKGFPPTFFSVGGDEMLLDDTLTVEKKMRKAGVSTVLEQQPEMFHTYILCMNSMPESKCSYQRLQKFVNDIFHQRRD